MESLIKINIYLAQHELIGLLTLTIPIATFYREFTKVLLSQKPEIIAWIYRVTKFRDLGIVTHLSLETCCYQYNGYLIIVRFGKVEIKQCHGNSMAFQQFYLQLI